MFKKQIQIIFFFLLVTCIVCLYSPLLSMEDDAEYFNTIPQQNNAKEEYLKQFDFMHDTYTLCTDDNDLGKTFIKEITQAELTILLSSSVIRNSLKLLSGNEENRALPKTIVVPESITQQNIDLILNLTHVHHTPQEWHMLYTLYNQLDINSEELKKSLLNHYHEIIGYCKRHKIKLSHPNDRDFLQNIAQSTLKEHSELASLLQKKLHPHTHSQLISQLSDSKRIQHIALSQDGDKCLYIAGNSAYIYVKKNGKFQEIKKIKKNVLSAGLSANGSTIMIGESLGRKIGNNPHELYCITWYVFTDNTLVKKGEKRIETDDLPKFKEDHYSKRNYCTGNIEYSSNYLKSRQLPIIYLSKNGSIGFFKFPGYNPFHIILDETKTKGILNFIKSTDSKTKTENWYQEMVAMSSHGICAHMRYSEPDYKYIYEDPECPRRAVYIDREQSNNLAIIDPHSEYFVSDSKSEFVDCLCLDQNADHILKVEGGKAYLASTNPKKESIIQYSCDHLCAGALSLDGSVAITGGTSGKVHIHVIGLNFTYSISNTIHYTGNKNTTFEYKIHKFVSKNPYGILALATNETGNQIAVGHRNSIVYYETSINPKFIDIAFIKPKILTKLSAIIKKKKNNPQSRPTNIARYYGKLPEWVQEVIKINLNVRTGWGPKATWNLLRNNNVDTRYKMEAVAPYIAGTAIATVGGYYAISKWFYK